MALDDRFFRALKPLVTLAGGPWPASARASPAGCSPAASRGGGGRINSAVESVGGEAPHQAAAARPETGKTGFA